jgi:thymidylate synthase (FAD)
MKIIGASYEILHFPENALELIEAAGRTCYKSEDKITPTSCSKFAEKMLALGHESVIEHMGASVRFIFDRGVSHEMVRHRLCAFSQESTRYCDYFKDKFGNHVTYIQPCFWDEGTWQYDEWCQAMEFAEKKYLKFRSKGEPPERARSVLPNSLKTEIVVSCNLREWRHIFTLRCSPKAHPQMREVMIPLLDEFVKRCEPLFRDIREKLNA